MATSDNAPSVLKRLRMPASVVEALACPHCGEPIGPVGNALRCAGGHAFDVAKEGYASLLTGGKPVGTADTAEMVAARQEFQEAGHFGPLSRRIGESAAGLLGGSGGLVADVGAGTGHYLSHVLDAVPEATGIALDISKFALRRAAKAHPRSGAAACDAWRGLPLRDGAAGLLLNVFAPRDAAEFHRALADGGALIVVTPGDAHLRELIEALGMVTVDSRKEERLDTALAGHFTRERVETIEYVMDLPHRYADTAAAMGPSAHHLTAEARREKVSVLDDPAQVTASFRLSVYRPL